MSFTVTTDNGKHLFPEHPGHHDKYCWCKQTASPPLPESDAALAKLTEIMMRCWQQGANNTAFSDQDTIAAENYVKRLVLKTRIEEMEASSRASTHERDPQEWADARIEQYQAELTALDQPTNVTQSEDDELYLRAWRAVYQRGVATTPFLQREFRISYGTANQLIDRMEREGVVEMFNPRRPRKVLKAPTGEQS